eukprot:gnl/Spiro4/6767_TR3496_c0_g1_i1.p1 gnl/Spiro4/6767_TR3496_c0_g1~~gnl/Spiro4/6767_TR3496_c0_g1_i1.p1  ORF type:complete len:214 (-),score=73.42 gnl/Spiro4/6767_TR3496_c0_g1_i1:106-747(-)
MAGRAPPPSGSPAPAAAAPAVSDQQYQQVFRKVVEACKRRGTDGIASLARTFRIMDDDGSKALTRDEFAWGLRDQGALLSASELQVLFERFDANRDGSINFDEFLYAFKGSLNPTRKAIIARAFAKLDRDGSGVITIEDIRAVYNAKNNPLVVTGKKTETEVLTQFLENFEAAAGGSDGRVTLEEFEKYYSYVSASIDDDAYFTTMMYQAWKL